LRIDAQALGVVEDGAIVVALEVIGAAAVEIGDVVAGSEPDRFAVIGDGAVVVALVFISNTAVVLISL
jgi:hypothetical protein